MPDTRAGSIQIESILLSFSLSRMILFGKAVSTLPNHARARACGRLARLVRGLRRERNEACALSDHLLRDIGLTRDDVLDPFEKASRHLREHD